MKRQVFARFWGVWRFWRAEGWQHTRRQGLGFQCPDGRVAMEPGVSSGGGVAGVACPFIGSACAFLLLGIGTDRGRCPVALPSFLRALQADGWRSPFL